MARPTLPGTRSGPGRRPEAHEQVVGGQGAGQPVFSTSSRAGGAGHALPVAAMVFAAGIFTGILNGPHMVDAMAQTSVQLVPPSLGPHFPVLTGLASAPLTFFRSNDAFYFGILPFFARAASAFGISAVAVGKALLLGQPVHLLSPLVPLLTCCWVWSASILARTSASR